MSPTAALIQSSSAVARTARLAPMPYVQSPDVLTPSSVTAPSPVRMMPSKKNPSGPLDLVSHRMALDHPRRVAVAGRVRNFGKGRESREALDWIVRP